MINRDHIETILKINGVSSTAADEEIRSILISARYNDDEVNSALMVLRENVNTKEIRVDGLHKVFRTDEALRPKEISLLLGIEVDHTELVVPNSKGRKISYGQIVLVSALSTILAVLGILFYMYQNELGVFHSSSGLVFSK